MQQTAEARAGVSPRASTPGQGARRPGSRVVGDLRLVSEASSVAILLCSVPVLVTLPMEPCMHEHSRSRTAGVYRAIISDTLPAAERRRICDVCSRSTGLALPLVG
jgi:hypothetical protein